ncbi:unnamed protein product [Adineta steineri]|uniref:Uncharacterized protein n=1 Tax=Adineta steineri TaxID=433720 RepID=A0A813PQI5_9BILA|nr:unnamed protein product [Adineta steineri]CAF0794285.1 unnamed protein product [Adineta steineri]CAF1574689.1 unnamed protein product [Adineta steineri]CAF1670696.1 unnamed protein product [Adineta steineri]
MAHTIQCSAIRFDEDLDDRVERADSDDIDDRIERDDSNDNARRDLGGIVECTEQCTKWQMCRVKCLFSFFCKCNQPSGCDCSKFIWEH